MLDAEVHRPWYPHTLIYSENTSTFGIFARAASRDEFKRLATLLGVASKEELLARYDSAVKNHGIDKWSRFPFHASFEFKRLFGFDRLDSVA